MASRFWVGNSGLWNDTTHWSTSSGGTGGASVPTSADSVYFDANSFTATGQTVTVNVVANCLDMDWTGVMNSPAINGSNDVNSYGNVLLNSSINWIFLGVFYLKSTVIGKLIKTEGIVFNSTIYFNGNGGWILQDQLSTNGYVTVYAGTLDLNGYDINCSNIYTNSTGIRNIYLRSSTIVCSEAFSIFNKTNLILDSGISKIVLTGNTKIFTGGSLTYNNVEFQGTPTTITGSNTFNQLKVDSGKILNLTAGTTQTVTELVADGATIQSLTSGSPATISSTQNQTVSTSTIKDITATGGGLFYAYDSTNVSGNTGWSFITTLLGSSNLTSTSSTTAESQLLQFLYGESDLTSSGTITPDSHLIQLLYGLSDLVGMSSVDADSYLLNILYGDADLTGTSSITAKSIKAIKTSLADAKASFFVLSDKMYLHNGTDLISYDGVTCADVVGYIPLILIGRSPTGSPNAGTVNEAFNLISPGFRVSFTATGTATAYTIPYTSLDATAITAIVNGVAMVEATNFTVNRTTGVVTFNIAPAIGVDNVIITAYKTSLAHPEYILNCKISEVFGGKSEATVFMSGNPNYPDLIWHSRLYGENYNADYFPDDAVQKVPGNVAGLAHIFDLLYVSHSKGHGYLSYADGAVYPIFPYASINLEKGSDIPGSIQEVDNSIVCASTSNGVMQVLGNSTVNDRLSVNDISDLVNKSGSGRTDLGILFEQNLTNAVSYNHDGYYGLCINDVCYVWDYKLNAWLYDTNVPASCFAMIDNTLCFGSNTDGIVYQFDPLIANDDGVAIDSWYDLREESAGTPNMVKVINRANLLAKPMSRGSTLLSFRSRKSNSDVVLTMQTSAFSFVGFNFVNFTFNTSFFPVLKRKRMSKRANYFQFRFSNNVLDEGMSVISLLIEFDKGSEVR